MIGNAQAQAQNASNPPLSHWSQTSLSTSIWTEHVASHLAQGQDVVDSILTKASSLAASSSLFGPNPTIDGKATRPAAVRRYRARIEFDLRFRDFRILSQFGSHLLSIEHCEIDSLTWVLPPSVQQCYKSELRTNAAKDARAKVVDYCQIFCPGQDEIMLIPIELKNENAVGGPSSMARRHDNVYARPATATDRPKKDFDLSFTPQEIEMKLSIDVIFQVQTNGFRLGAILNETDISLRADA